MDYTAMFPWARKDLLKEVSVYSSFSLLEEFRNSFSRGEESFIETQACYEGEPVCNDEGGDPQGPFCFFYETCFTRLGLRLPLDPFEKEILTELNASPTQLHPNSWAFVRAFRILFYYPGFTPTLNIFFYFFEFKTSPRKLWTSLNSVGGRGLLSLFQSSYKNFKGHFIKVRPSTEVPSLLEGLPLYWASKPRPQPTRRSEILTPYERGICNFLEGLGVMFETPKILKREHQLSDLKTYLGIALIFLFVLFFF